MKPQRNNPPWADKILKKNWAALTSVAGAAAMPVPLTEHATVPELRRRITGIEASTTKGVTDEYWLNELTLAKASLAAALKKKPKGWREYGAGHYGVVYPTNTVGLVIKITTDPTEAAFTAAYLSMKPNQRPVGVIRYHSIVRLPQESKSRRPVFVLWRDEAQYVGPSALKSEWLPTMKDNGYFSRSLRSTEVGIVNIKKCGDDFRNWALKAGTEKVVAAVAARDAVWQRYDIPQDQIEYGRTAARLKGTDKGAYILNRVKALCDELQNEPVGIDIGRALDDLMGEGLLLCDVHLNNIGTPHPAVKDKLDMSGYLLITDPGHAIALDNRWAGVQIPDLPPLATNPRRRK